MNKTAYNARFAAFVVLTALLYYLLFSNFILLRDFARPQGGLYEMALFVLGWLAKAAVGTIVVGTIALAIGYLNPYPDYGRYVSVIALTIYLVLAARYFYRAEHYNYGGFRFDFDMGFVISVCMGVYLAVKANVFFHRQRYL
jgi:hypothetical protein